jgi:hypothetical protein
MREEILAMKPGTELNRKVAEEIMGYEVVRDYLLGYVERLIDPQDGSSVWCPLCPYSEDRSVAESVIDKMIQLGYDDAIYWADFGDGVYTEAEAICKAARLALIEKRRKEKIADDILHQVLGDDWQGADRGA